MGRPAGVEIVAVGEVLVGMSQGVPEVALDDFDVLLTTSIDPPRPWVTGLLDDIEGAVIASPDAAVALVRSLRVNRALSVSGGLHNESLAYSTLQHGEVFQQWLTTRGERAVREEPGEPVRLERAGERLEIALQRPHVHNAMNAAIRDALCEAFELVAADPSITDVQLTGDGPSFCSGGDLDEFGLATDPTEAHRIRVDRSVGRRVHDHADKVTARLHGSCIGAGIELSAFAGRVVAAPDTTIRLPELAMGLIPGAGGTVSIPRRIGRHRTAYLALTGRPIDAPTALAWGLVDDVV